MVKIILFLINIIGSALISIFCFDVSPLITIILTLAFFIAFLLVEIIVFFLIPFIAGIGHPSKIECTTYHKGYRKLYTIYVKLVDSLFSVKIKKIGFEKIPTGPVIFIANHRSNMDPFVMEDVLAKWPMIFVGKKTLFNIPFFGRIINCVGYQRINSNFLIKKSPKEVFEDKKHDLQTIKNCINLVNDQKVSIAIYPEAMRNFQDKVLLDFKHGCFHIAKKTQVPIVVMTLKGTENFKNKKTILLKKHRVEIKVLDVINADHYMPMSNDEIAKEIYDEMYIELHDYYTDYINKKN